MVINESGVPGVLNRMAGTAPPSVEPFMMPIRKPSTGSRAAAVKPKLDSRMGSDTAIANGPDSPGMAPTTMPASRPENTITSVIEIGSPNTTATGSAVNTAASPRRT